MSNEKFTVENLKKYKGAETLTDKQLQKLADLLNLAPEVVTKKKIETLIAIV